MLHIDAHGATVDLPEGRYTLLRLADEDDAGLIRRAGQLAAMTARQRRGLQQRQQQAAARISRGNPRNSDSACAAMPVLAAADPSARTANDEARVASALKASGIAARLFGIDTEGENS